MIAGWQLSKEQAEKLLAIRQDARFQILMQLVEDETNSCIDRLVSASSDSNEHNFYAGKANLGATILQTVADCEKFIESYENRT